MYPQHTYRITLLFGLVALLCGHLSARHAAAADPLDNQITTALAFAERNSKLTSSTDYQLVFSTWADRRDPVVLDGQVVNGSIYVLVPATDGIKQVNFWLDRTSSTQSPLRIEKTPPYDLMGGTATVANPLNALSEGQHTITAEILRTDGTKYTTSASFEAEPPNLTEMLRVSPNPDRSSTVDLHGRSLSGKEYIYIEERELAIKQVNFYIDDPSRTRPFYRSEVESPYDLMGAASSGAYALDTTGLSNGTHTVIAELIYSEGDTVSLREAGFTVSNPSSSYDLRVSMSSNRSNTVLLKGKVVKGNIYVVMPATSGVREVAWRLDDPNRLQPPRRIESSAPWDFISGGSTAAPFDTRSVADGAHFITIDVIKTDGSTTIIHALFTVDN